MVKSAVEESFSDGLDGTSLYVRRRSGPSSTTAVLCDGIVCDGFIYKYLWEDLAKNLSVAHWHYRGHGRSGSPVNADCIDVSDHAHDLDSVRRGIDDPPVVLIGHSFGTQVILEAYRLRAERVSALILMCGTFGRVTHTFKGTDILASVLPGLIDFVIKHPKVARGLWTRVPPKVALKVAFLAGEMDGKAVSEEDVEPYFRHVPHVDFQMFLKMLEKAGQHSAEDLLSSIQVPVLIIAGDKDTFTPPALSEAMAEIIPKAELLMIPGGTHVTPLEHHEKVNERIMAFLSKYEIR